MYIKEHNLHQEYKKLWEDSIKQNEEVEKQFAINMRQRKIDHE